jgi:hypothetical protein
MLDDIRSMDDVRKYTKLPNIPNEQWTVVRSYSDFVEVVNKLGLPMFVSFDHDLGLSHYGHGSNGDDIPYDSYTEKTGYDAAKWLVDYCMKNGVKHPPYVVHSMNPVGKRNIESYIESYLRTFGDKM